MRGILPRAFVYVGLMGLALADVRVVDLGEGIAGAYATKLLADAGADVVKLEPPGGDPLRRRVPLGVELPAAADGALFGFLCAGKRSVVADLDTEEGRAFALDLTARADLVFQSAGPGSGEARGLSPEALQARNPLVSWVSISSFGADGPWSGQPASEFTLQALCGSTAFRGLPERPPLAAGGHLGEWLGGVYAAIGGLLALRRARRDGRGERVDVSLYECMSVALNFYEYLKASLGGDLDAYANEQFERQIEVPSVELARDGYVGFALFTEQMWREFAEMVGRPDLASDPDLRFMLSRWPRRREVYAAIHPWLRQHGVDEIVAEASRRRIPVAPIGDGRTIPEMEHFAATGTFTKSPSGGFLQPRVPYRLSRAETRPPAAAPQLGAHSDELRQELSRTAELRVPARAAVASGRPPLEGLRVVDFTQFIAGPTVTHVLAAMGADVIKIEAIQRPDGIRFASSQPPSVERWWEYSWVFHGLNAGKRSVTLDLSRPAGLELVKRLIARADIAVENFAPHVIEEFGLGYEEIERLNPRAILVRMPAFGLRGPWRDRVGLAQTMEQLSGMAGCTGFRDGPPVIPRGPCDAVAGLHACFAGLVALAERDRSGRGQLVESIMVESALNVAAQQVVEYSAYGTLLERDGNRDPQIAPQNLYACRGRECWLALSIETDAQWQALCRWLGDPAWTRDPAFAQAGGRRAAQERIDAELGQVFADRPLDESVAELLALGIPAAPVVVSPLVARSPQHAARSFFEPLTHPLAGRQGYPRLPMRFSAGPARCFDAPPPLLGQHNDEVLGGELGLSKLELEELRASGIAGETPIGF